MSGRYARSRFAAVLATFSVALGAQAVTSQVARAVPSADVSALAFTVTNGEFSQIYTAAPDGTDPAPLPGQPSHANNTDPAASPDGTKIAFTSDSSGNLDVWVLDLTSSTSTQLTTDPGADSAPAWSPDGKTIAFQSSRSGNLDIWLMHPDGSSQTRLTTNPANDSQPTWFPTGHRIAFQSSRTGGTDIYAVNTDATGLKRVTTSTAPDTQPSVGPAGGTIAFASKRNGNTDIYTVPAGGGTSTRVTSNTAAENQPAFSPDGRWLAFTSTRTGIAQVFAVPRPTGAAIQLTNGSGPAFGADYIPSTYPTPAWVDRVTGNETGGSSDYPNAIARTPDGSKVFSVGVVGHNGYAVNGYVSANASNGQRIWLRTFQYQGYGNAYAVAVSPDGTTVYVAGYAGNYTFIGSYNAGTGIPVTSRMVLFAGAYSSAWAIAVSPDGSTLYVDSTEYDAQDHPLGARTFALNSGTLATLWNQYIPKGDPVNGAIRVSPSGNAVYWVGVHYGADTSKLSEQDYEMAAYQTSNGAPLWNETYNATSKDDIAWALTLSPDGSDVYVTGYSQGVSSGGDQATLKLNATSGSVLWTSRYNSPANRDDWGFSLTISSDGSTLYSAGGRGRAVGSATTYDYLATSMNASNGSVNWARFYNGPGDYMKSDAFDEGYDAELSPDGSHLFVTGQSYRTGTSFDLATVAYDTSGNQLWIARYNNSTNGQEYAPSAVLTGDGSKLYVTGESKGTKYYAGATLAWDLGGIFAARTRIPLVDRSGSAPGVGTSTLPPAPYFSGAGSFRAGLRGPGATSRFQTRVHGL